MHHIRAIAVVQIIHSPVGFLKYAIIKRRVLSCLSVHHYWLLSKWLTASFNTARTSGIIGYSPAKAVAPAEYSCRKYSFQFSSVRLQSSSEFLRLFATTRTPKLEIPVEIHSSLYFWFQMVLSLHVQ